MKGIKEVFLLALLLIVGISSAFAESLSKGEPLPDVDDPDHLAQEARVAYMLQSGGDWLAKWIAAYRCYVGYRGKTFPKRYAIIFGKVDGKYEKRPEVYEENGKQKKRDRWYLLGYDTRTYWLCPEKPFIHRSPFGRMKDYLFGSIQTRKIFPGEIRQQTKSLAGWVARYCGFVASSYKPQPYAFYVAAVTDMLIEGKSIRKTATYFGVECFKTQEEREAFAYQTAVKLGVVKPKKATHRKGKGRGG